MKKHERNCQKKCVGRTVSNVCRPDRNKVLSSQLPASPALDCRPSAKPPEPCEIEQEKRAIKQINEIKKYMIGSSEFDVLEKLIDLNAPKFVIDYQMRRVEQEEQNVIIDSEVNIMFSDLEKECQEEVTRRLKDKCDPPKRNVCPPSTSTLSRIPQSDIGQRHSTCCKDVYRPSTSQIGKEIELLRSQQKNIAEKLQNCKNLNTGKSNTDSEQKFLENLEILLDAEHVDAKEISNIFPQKAKECDGIITDTAGLTFKEIVKKNLIAIVEKINEKEEVQPEVAAAMLHSEEKGVGLKRAPREIYDTLFPGNHDKRLIGITPASTAKPTDILPIPVIKKKLRSRVKEEDAALFDFIRPDEEKKFSLPQANLQDEESGTNEDELMGFVDSQLLNDEAATFKVMLSPEVQATSSQVQMRGSQPPTWFPGYFIAFPDTEEVIPLEKPWTILEKAWQKFRPSNVKPKKGTIVIGT